MHRRSFLKNTGLTLGALAFLDTDSIARAFFADPWKIKMLRNDVGVFTEKGGTIAFLFSKKGTVVVDSQFPEQSQHLIDELKKRQEKPFRMLINTHHHGDHTSGNISFKGLVKDVLGHTNCLANHKRVAAEQKTLDKQLFATQTFDTSWKKKFGKERIHAQHLGPAHTNGDAIIHFQHANVAHLGDLVFNRRFPYIDKAAGANIANWIQVLEKTINYFDSETIFVFGHALDPEKITGGKDDLRAFQNYLSKLLDFVRSEVASGKTKEEIMKATSIPGASEWQGHGIERSLTAAFEEVTSSTTNNK
jgi:cyclase